MNSLYPYVKPLADAWNRYLNDPYMKDLEEFTAGGYGQDWNSKAAKRELNQFSDPYHEYLRRFNEDPKLNDVFADNFYRLTFLCGFERLITLRQAHGALKSRFTIGDSNTASFQQMIQTKGLLSGYFKGSIWNIVQFMANQFHPLYYSKGKDYTSHFFFTSLIETLLYPIDTIKTLLYADTQGAYRGAVNCIEKTYQQGGLRGFYQGFVFKLLFNGSLVFHLRNLYEKDSLIYLSYPLLAFSYGFLTIKTRLQLCNSPLIFTDFNKPGRWLASTFLQKGIFGLYRGLVPFLFLNTFFHYNLYALYSKQAQINTLQDIQLEIKNHFKSPRKETLWS